MGTLMYGAPGVEIDFDDRALAHLQVVITAKLRRGEPFTFTWVHAPASGSGRSSVWLHPAIPLQFSFNGSRMPAINPTWVRSLMEEANSGRGLRIIPEPAPQPESVGLTHAA